MNDFAFTLAGAALRARPDGTLHWPAAGLLAVSDLHLGKAERIARRGGTLLPPYDSAETLERLARALEETAARVVICLGDSFDDDAAARALPAPLGLRLAALMAGRRWIWIAGNHDPGPVALGGSHHAEWAEGAVVFRHIARPLPDGGTKGGEISGHYHPKVRLPGAGPARAAFLIDTRRVILPAFGAYTGGLASTAPVLSGLMAPGALAVLTGRRAVPAPMPRAQPSCPPTSGKRPSTESR